LAHELQQQLDYLRAALEQDKKPLGFLVGAGAPMSIQVDGHPLVPGLIELTEFVMSEIGSPYSSALATLLGQLSESESKDLEAVLNYVRSLASLPGTEDIRGVSVEVLSKLDEEICRIVRRHVDQLLPEGDNAYFAFALWITAVRRLAPIQIFTTNYDLLMEQALERQKVAYFDGFMGSREPVFDLVSIEEDQLPSRWSLLWKLHGSINWFQDSSGRVTRRTEDPDDNSTALVYPSHLKYDQGRRLPYLAMMDRFKSFLRRPGAILVTVGFSFRDQHIVEMIDQSLRANATSCVQGLLFGPLSDYGEAEALARTLPNLVLLADDAAIVGSVKDVWRPSESSTDASGAATKCEIGDFSEFGKLLRDLTGGTHYKED